MQVQHQNVGSVLVTVVKEGGKNILGLVGLTVGLFLIACIVQYSVGRPVIILSIVATLCALGAMCILWLLFKIFCALVWDRPGK